MKQIKKVFLAFPLLFLSILAIAQDKKVDVDIDVNKGGSSNWYQQPWVWVVGAAVFIIIIVAILKGSGNRSNA